MSALTQSRDFVERYMLDNHLVWSLHDQENLEHALEDFLDDIEEEHQEEFSATQQELEEALQEKQDLESDLYASQKEHADAIVRAEKAERRLREFVDATV